MKKKILSWSLIVLLGMSLPVSAAPAGHHAGCHHRPVVAPPCHHVHHSRPSVGVSFSTGVLARRSYWDPYYYYNCPIGYPMYNRYYDYPIRVVPKVYMNFRI